MVYFARFDAATTFNDNANTNVNNKKYQNRLTSLQIELNESYNWLTFGTRPLCFYEQMSLC